MAANAVDIAATIGFGDTFRPGYWTPVAVTVANHGESLRGELEVEVTADDAARGETLSIHHRRALELARDGRKILHFTVLPQGLFHPLVIRVRAGGKEIARTEIDLRTRFAPQRLLVALSRNADFDFLNDGAVDGLRVLYPHPELLPAHWRGYESVAAVLLWDVSLERLSTSQFEALHKWAAQGGILAVCGGPNSARLKGGRLASLLPGIPTGMERIEPAALNRALDLDAVQPGHVNRLRSLRGAVRLRAGDVPLVVERPLGEGRVVFFAFDVASAPFARWNGLGALLLDHLRLPPARGEPRAPDPGAANALAALIRAQAPAFPRFAAALLFVVLYLSLLFTCSTLPVQGARRRWPRAWWVWGIPVLFAPVAWLLFGPSVYPRGASAATVALIEPLQDGAYARFKLELGVYSNRSGPLHFEYGGAAPVLYPHRQAQRAGKFDDWVLGDGARTFVQPFDRHRYALHALEGEDVIGFPLEASVRASPDGPHVRLRNAGNRALDELWLVFDGHAYALGALASGAGLDRQLIASQHGIDAGANAWGRILTPFSGLPAYVAGPAQMLLERKAKARGEAGYPRAGHALLLGYTTSPLRPAGTSERWSRQEMALMAFEIAAEAADPTQASDGGSAAHQVGEHEGSRLETPQARANRALQPRRKDASESAPD